MANEPQTLIAPELQALPLGIIVSSAMQGIVTAQSVAAKTTLDFIKTVSEQPAQEFKMTVSRPAAGPPAGRAAGAAAAAAPQDVSISVPPLAIVPIPSIRVDSATIHFTFEIKQVDVEKKDNNQNLTIDVSASGLLGGLIGGSLKGSVSHSSSRENTVNRSGMIDITIHLSEPPMPEGLAKILDSMTKAIQMP